MLPAGHGPGMGRGRNTLAPIVMLCHRFRTGEKRTVKSLCCARDVSDTEVSCEDEKEWDEVRPRAGSTVRERDLKGSEAGTHHMLRDVAPSWEARLESADNTARGLPIGRTAIGCSERCRGG